MIRQTRSRSAFLALTFALAFAACSHDDDRDTRSPGATSTRARAAPAATPGTRTVSFTYEVKVPEVPAGTRELKVWIPMARDEEGVQRVLDQRVAPPAAATVEEGRSDKGDNRFWVVTVPAPVAPVVITATFDVERRELVRNRFRNVGATALSAEERTAMASYLQPDEMVPVGGRFEAMARTAGGGETNKVNLARNFYDDVLKRMRYSKEGTGWGRGSSDWACDSGYGNCTDFHSLFMSMARSEGIPARFTMGFPLPDERGAGDVGGYHCWAEFYTSDTGWVPVDISEADKHPDLAQYYFGSLTEDRISFTRGRDLMLTPSPRSGRQNFFIYPIAEADGAPVKYDKRFAFTDR